MIVYLDGERVKARREELLMSREEFAKETGVGLSTLRHVEKGEVEVRLSTARKIAGFLGVDPRQLARAKSNLKGVAVAQGVSH